jgi:hypothetical protein
MREQEVRNLWEAYLEVCEAKDETEEGITGQPIPKRKLGPAKRHEFEKKRREERKKRNDPRAGDSLSQHRMTGSRGHGSEYENTRSVREEIETDLFDIILEHIVSEGYADTNEAALAIMANMSEEWRESIVEGKSDRPLGYMHPFARGMKQPKGEKSEEKHGQDTEGNITGKYKVKGV